MKPILFDLDGTITDPKPGFLASVNYALEELGQPARPEEELIEFIGPPLRGTMAFLLHTEHTGLIEKGVELYRKRLDDGGKFEADLHEGMTGLIKDLHTAGHPLFVATGKPRCVAAEIIEHFGLDPFFKKVYGAELDGRFADKADLVKHLYKEQGLNAGDGVIVGDTAFDIRAGKLNDLETIGVEWGYGTVDEMRSEGADRMVAAVEELRTVLCA